MFDDFGDIIDIEWTNYGFASGDDDMFDPWAAYETLGNPEIDKSVWQEQETPFTCAVVSQQMILELFGIELSEAELVYEATYDPRGMQPTSRILQSPLE